MRGPLHNDSYGKLFSQMNHEPHVSMCISSPPQLLFRTFLFPTLLGEIRHGPAGSHSRSVYCLVVRSALEGLDGHDSILRRSPFPGELLVSDFGHVQVTH